MTPAQGDIAAIADWLADSSRMRRSPMAAKKAATQPGLAAHDVQIGPYATLLPVDPNTTDYPDLSGLALDGLALFAPVQQMPSTMPKTRLEMEPYSHPPLVRRIAHMFGHKMGVELPDVLTIALDDPAQSISAALSAEGLGDLNLDAVAVLAVPLWACPATDRAEITRLCKHP